MKNSTKGILAMVLACFIWSGSALYYRMLKDIPPLEVLSHRIIWSAVFLFILLLMNKRLSELRELVSSPRVFMLVSFAALMISINWFTYIYAIQIDQLIQSSLGYFIFPLVAVAFGYLFLGERLSKWQWVAISLVFAAVLLFTFSLNIIPWIALFIAFAMGFYGLAKKPLTVSPLVSVLGEALFLLPLALIWLWGVHVYGWIGLGNNRVGGHFDLNWTGVILMFSGPLTAIPLVLMTYSVKRLSLGTVGLVQYTNPSLQFLIAILIFSEPISPVQFVVFGIIWSALLMYIIDIRRNNKSNV